MFVLFVAETFSKANSINHCMCLPIIKKAISHVTFWQTYPKQSNTISNVMSQNTNSIVNAIPSWKRTSEPLELCHWSKELFSWLDLRSPEALNEGFLVDLGPVSDAPG